MCGRGFFFILCSDEKQSIDDLYIAIVLGILILVGWEVSARPGQ